MSSKPRRVELRRQKVPPKKGVFECFKDTLNSLTLADVEEFPLLHLLFSHKELLNYRLFEMLMKAIIDVLENLVKQLLAQLSTRQLNSIISVVDEVTRFVAGLVVFFTVSYKKQALSSDQVASLAMRFDATPNVSEGAEVKFCSPMFSFCRELAKLDHDFPITEVSVQIPITLKQKLRKNSNAAEAWRKFLRNKEPEEVPYPLSAYMCEMGLEPKKVTLCDKYQLETVILDPAHQYILLHGVVFFDLVWYPSWGSIVFTSFLHNGFKQKASCFYNASNSVWYLEILQNTEPLKNTSCTDSVVEWESISIYRLHEAKPTITETKQSPNSSPLAEIK